MGQLFSNASKSWWWNRLDVHFYMSLVTSSCPQYQVHPFNKNNHNLLYVMTSFTEMNLCQRSDTCDTESTKCLPADGTFTCPCSDGYIKTDFSDRLCLGKRERTSTLHLDSFYLFMFSFCSLSQWTTLNGFRDVWSVSLLINPDPTSLVVCHMFTCRHKELK